MTQQPIRFDDGAAYERLMGTWSPIVGNIFLDWLAPAPGLRWLDVGCGNGAFTELLLRRCAPAAIEAIDPSEGQLAFARQRSGARGAVFHQGDAMALPFAADSFDAAIMALVIHFVPEPPRGVAEMVRVVRPGGIVAAYVWDGPGNGSPSGPFNDELSAMGKAPAFPPSNSASSIAALLDLWTKAGLRDVETRAITVARTHADFDDLWSVVTGTGAVKAAIAGMDPAMLAELQDRLRARLPADSEGRVTYSSRANAIKGRVPA